MPILVFNMINNNENVFFIVLTSHSIVAEPLAKLVADNKEHRFGVR